MYGWGLCLVVVVYILFFVSFLCLLSRFLLTMPQVCLQFVIVVFPDHTHLLNYNCSDIFIHTYKKYRLGSFFGGSKF